MGWYITPCVSSVALSEAQYPVAAQLGLLPVVFPTFQGCQAPMRKITFCQAAVQVGSVPRSHHQAPAPATKAGWALTGLKMSRMALAVVVVKRSVKNPKMPTTGRP